MMAIWRYIRRSASEICNANSDKPYDEECLKWGLGSWSGRQRTRLRVPRLRQATLFIFLIDLMIITLLLQVFEPLITLLRRNEELFGPRVALSGSDNSNSWHQTDQPNKIPRILHQTTATETIPDKWVQSQRSCMEAYSEFEYKLWTDESARDFLSAQYPWFVDIWDNYAFPIQRADSIRYFVLYHYGGVYLDMDTWCNQTLPIHQIESDTEAHNALFKSTLPTGVTNDFMVVSARHPAYAAAIARLSAFNAITWFWARWQPYCAIMVSAGPMFLTMVMKDYLLEQPSSLWRTIQVINATELAPYITDLESSTWHRADAKVLMWIGDRRWTWFGMGAIGLVAGLYVLNNVLMIVFKLTLRIGQSALYSNKLAKEA